MDANKESCTIIIMYTALPFILVILSLCSSVHGRRSSLRGKEYKHEKSLERKLEYIIKPVDVPGAVTVAPPPATTNVTILELVASTDELSTLDNLLVETALIDILSGPGPFTLFAPTNEAFASVANWNYIHSTPEILEGFLEFHIIVDATMLSQDFQLGQLTKTLEGRKLNVTSLDPLKVNQATVTQADIVASNGVMHIIDKVMIPRGRTPWCRNPDPDP